jgi:hypothetical protein
VTCTVCVLSVEQRGRGEVDRWAATTVSGGGAADERGPSGSGRGREEWGTDRQDRPVSGCGRRRGCSLRGARVSRPRKEKVGRAQRNNKISDLFKSVLNKWVVPLPTRGVDCGDHLKREVVLRWTRRDTRRL